MHDLHEAQPLMYDYSGGPPQNPNLDPILFAELPFFANWELAQMTKWGMPGVYTHAFMDGWSPGYLGSVAYNHNGMMRMYETQSGKGRPPPGPARATRTVRCGARAQAVARRGRCGRWRWTRRSRRRARCGGGGGAAAAVLATSAAAGAGGAGAGGAQAPPAAGRGGGARPAAVARRRRPDRPRRRAGSRVVSRHSDPPGRARNFTRRNNTNYMETGVLSGCS